MEQMEWPGALNVGDSRTKGNVAGSLQWREIGMNSKGSAFDSRILQEAAEDLLVKNSKLNERCCELPGVPKSTFLMVFSPDGTKVASTHGNHRIYISELSSGKHVKTLNGHPRTPWCIAFHPSHPRLLGSGCLGGQVRVWDLVGKGGSEVWTVSGRTVIASIAFHPRDRLLVIATYNEFYFWDWMQPEPYAKVTTKNLKEKVRFVSFDPLGHKLITGISVWTCGGGAGSLLQPVPGSSPAGSQLPNGAPPQPSGTPQDQISTYQHLLQRYDNLFRNYHHIFMARSQQNTTDRGTDPMDVDAAGQPSTSSGSIRMPLGPQVLPNSLPGSTDPSNSRQTPDQATNPGQSSVPVIPGEPPSVGVTDSQNMPPGDADSRGPSSSRGQPPPDPARKPPRNLDGEDSDSGDDPSGGAGGSLNLDVQSISLGNTPTVNGSALRTRWELPDTMTFVTTSSPRVSAMAMPGERVGFGSGASQSAFRPLSESFTSSSRRVSNTSNPTTDEDAQRAALRHRYVYRPRYNRSHSHRMVILNRSHQATNTNSGVAEATELTLPEVSTTSRGVMEVPVTTPRLEPEPEPNIEPKPEPELKIEPKPELKSEPDLKRKPEPELKSEPDLETKSESVLKPDLEPLRSGSLPLAGSSTSTHSTSEAPNASSSSTLESQILSSLNSVQGYMQNSPDETSTERNDSARTSGLNILRDFSSLRNSANPSFRQHPHMISLDRNSLVHSCESRESRHTRDRSHTRSSRRRHRSHRRRENPPPAEDSSSQPANNNPESSQDVNIAQRFDSIGNMMRDSRVRLLNLITEFSEFTTVRRILHVQPPNVQDPANPSGSGSERGSRQTPNGNAAPANGSDNNRDMFSPLPFRVNLRLAPRTSFFESTQTSSISMHIDNEDRHFRRGLAPSDDEREPPSEAEPGQGEITNPIEISIDINNRFPPTAANLAPRNLSPRQSYYQQQVNEILLRYLTDSINQAESLQSARNSSNEPSQNQSSSSLQTPAQQPAQTSGDLNPSAPSRPQRPGEGGSAIVLVNRGVRAIERHTQALVDLCSTNAARPPIRLLPQMWDDLRRVVASIHASSGQSPGAAKSFHLSPQTRSRLLNFMASAFPDPSRSLRYRLRNERSPSGHTSSRRTMRNVEHSATESDTSAMESSQSNDVSNSQINPEPSTSSGARHSAVPTNGQVKTYPPSSRVRSSSGSFFSEDSSQSMRRRIRSMVLNRLRNASLQRIHPSLGQRRSSRNPTPHRQELEISRETVRFHAERVLGLMFSMMVQCRVQVSQVEHLITVMLASLKKALGLSCLLLVSQPFPNESLRSSASNSQPSTSIPSASAPQSPVVDSPSTSAEPVENSTATGSNETSETPSSSSWVDGITIQIAAVNRNYSSKAKKRKEKYNIFKRNQALKNRNPTLHLHPSKNETSAESEKTSTSANSNSLFEAPTPEDPVPSTSGLQRNRASPSIRYRSAPPPVTPSSVGTFPNANSRRVYSRMLFRRYLYNHGVMRDSGVFRRPDNQRYQFSMDTETPSSRPTYRPRIFSVRGATSTRAELSNRNVIIDSYISNVVPLVRVNDVPVSEVGQAPRIGAFPPPPPHYPLREQPIIPQNIMSVEENGGAIIIEGGSNIITETSDSPVHRIQVWDFTKKLLPDICNSNINVVVQKCKIHNDASIDISRDGRLLVALLPAQGVRNTTHQIGIYSLEWSCLGQCLYTTLLEQNAVSIALSPCARHLAVGLGSRRINLQPYSRNSVMALIFRLEKNESKGHQGRLAPVRSLNQSGEDGITSLNCLRWAPQPGQGLVYANNTGQLKILS